MSSPPLITSESTAPRRWGIFIPLLILFVATGIWAAIQRLVSPPSVVTLDGPARVDPSLHLRKKTPLKFRSISGIVRDASGHPVQHVTVFAVNPSRRGTRIFQATTDAKGQYIFTSIPDGKALDINLVTAKSGNPPAFDAMMASQVTIEAPDLILPESAGSLAVQVHDEKGLPAPRIPVKIIPEFATSVLGDGRPGDLASPISLPLKKILLPGAMTNEKGMVHFSGLLPGHYYITAGKTDWDEAKSEGWANDPLGMWHLPTKDTECAVAYGVAVAPREESRFLMRLQQAKVNTPIRYLLPGGDSYNMSNTFVWYKEASYSGNWGGQVSMPRDQNNEAFWKVPMVSGMQRLIVGVKPPAIDIAPEHSVLSSTATLAISPYRPRSEAVKLHLMVLSPAELRKRELNEYGYPSSGGGGGSFGGGAPVNLLPSKVQVVLPDGKTPAVGAYVFVDNPSKGPHAYYSNARGESRSGGFTIPQDHNRIYAEHPIWGKNDRESQKEQRVIALLPGVHGATILPLSQVTAKESSRLVLPPALSLMGRVFVGDKPLRPSIPGVVRVAAICISHGYLNDLLSEEVTAQGDGTFTFSGLTPGRYVIQAALDDIWCSQYRQIEVTAGSKLVPMRLTIPLPGKPVVVPLGKECTGAKVIPIIKGIPGPLEQRYTPAFYMADGIGELRLEGLTAGTHRFRLESGKVIDVTVPIDP